MGRHFCALGEGSAILPKSNSPGNGQGVKLLERAFALADELGDGDAGFLTERAFDECLL